MRSPWTADERRAWMRELSLAGYGDLEARWTATQIAVPHRVLRGPEVGLIAVRGRVDATGPAFTLGDMTITRCEVELGSGERGVGVVAGRNRQHAFIAALCDALLQATGVASLVASAVIEPLRESRLGRRRAVAANAASTRVATLETALEGR